MSAMYRSTLATGQALKHLRWMKISSENTDNVFEASEATEIYKMIDGFEGAHRFGQSATWTQEEERTLVRTVRPLESNLYFSDALTSWIGALPSQRVSCSSHFSLTVAT